MGKVGGNRNFGYGKQMAWAGGQAVADRYGQGHFATVAAHTERWGQLAAWARSNGIRDAREITTAVVIDFGRELAEQVRQGTTAVSYAKNLLSTVNVVMEAMRCDREVRVSPAEIVSQRERVRTASRDAQGGWAGSRGVGHRARPGSRASSARGLHAGCASVAERGGPASGGERHGGHEGRRGNRVDRWVPVAERAVETIGRAAAVQGPGRNLIPATLDWRQWNDRLHRVWANVRGEHGLARLHDLRTAYACDRYRQLTGCSAPVVAGAKVAARDADRAARQSIAGELGHSRIEVVAAYVGSAR